MGKKKSKKDFHVGIGRIITLKKTKSEKKKGVKNKMVGMFEHFEIEARKKEKKARATKRKKLKKKMKGGKK